MIGPLVYTRQRYREAFFEILRIQVNAFRFLGARRSAPCSNFVAVCVAVLTPQNYSFIDKPHSCDSSGGHSSVVGS